MRRLAATLLVLGVSVAACARPQYVSQEHAALQTPVPIAEGNTGKPPLPARPTASNTPASAGAMAGEAQNDSEGAMPSIASLPDPEPAATRVQYDLSLRYCEQAVHVVRGQRLELANATTLPTRMGRFALEVGIGRELLDRARFDFPLLGAEPAQGNFETAPRFAPKADVSRVVRISAQPRATWARVVDRATGEVWLVDWPPLDRPTPASNTEQLMDAPCPSVDRPPAAAATHGQAPPTVTPSHE